MTYEKPWQQEFTQLLKELEATLGGQMIRQLSTPKPDSEWGASLEVGASYFNYDRFRCELEGVRVEVEISHYALLGDSALVEGDYEEFLVVSAQIEPVGVFRVHPKGFFDRIRKALRFSGTFETGDKEFDQMFCLIVPDKDSEPLVKRKDVQASIKALMPFEFLQAHPGGIRCSELIADMAQLESAHVAERLRHVARLAGQVRDQKSNR